MLIKQAISLITPSITLGITNRAKEMATSGKKIYSFAAGEPDFDTPEHIKQAAVKALDASKTKYAPVSGIAELRFAIAEKLERENGLCYEKDQIVISNGAKHSLFNILMTLCRNDDEVVISAPYWLSYPEMVRIAGGKPVFVSCREENNFKIDPGDFEKAITKKTKAVIINSPSNPAGIVYTGYELKVLAEIAIKHNLYIVSDEIYEKLVYDGIKHVSTGSFSREIMDRTITVNGFSKAYAMTGWRLGYFAGPIEMVKAITAFQSHSTSAPNTFAQYGALEALRGSTDWLIEMTSAFQERRSYMYDRLNVIDGITCVKPEGAFYMLPNISRFRINSIEFAERLLMEKGVAVIPGATFGADSNIRLSYACSMADIEQGMNGIESFIAGL